MRKLFGKTVHVEVMRANISEARTYVTKEDTRISGPVEMGEPHDYQAKNRDAGKQNKWPEIRELIEAGATLDQLRQDDRYTAMTYMYVKAIEEHILRVYNRSRLEEIPEEPKWRPWQRQLLEMTQDNRTITWIVDLPGGNGKTFLAKWAQRYQKAIRLEMGKLVDLKYAYSQSLAPVVYFDVTRYFADKMQWGFLENLKDGTFLSTKYKSRVVEFEPPKVVVFSNFEPRMTNTLDNGSVERVLSDDRWQVFKLQDQELRDITPRLVMEMNQALKGWTPAYGGAFGR